MQPTNQSGTHARSQPAELPNFVAAYTIGNFAQLGQIRMPSSEVALTVLKITPEMLQLNNQLAREIHQLALEGLVGFSYADANVIQFRQDIAEKLQEVRQFRVYTHGNLQNSHTEENFQVEGIDAKKYKAALKALHLITGSNEKTEKDEGKKKAEKSTRGTHSDHTAQVEDRTPAAHKITRPRVARVRSSQKTVVQQEYQHRQTRAKEKKETEKVREKNKIEREVIKGEVKNQGIRKKEALSSQQRENRNFGDEKEDKPNVNSRSTSTRVGTHRSERKRKNTEVTADTAVKRRKTK